MNNNNISIIVAVAANNAIGANGDLAFHIKADMIHFKQTTMNKPVIMGRKTFQSLPSGALPGRRNIVITRNTEFSAPDIETAPSLAHAIDLVGDTTEAMIIGGAQIYEQALPFTNKIYLTLIDAECPNADTFFPKLNINEWEKKEQSPKMTDERTGLSYQFITLIRSTTCHSQK